MLCLRRTLTGVRVRDVQVGGTYLVQVPHELPRDRWPWDPWDPRMWLRMVWLRGRRFALSITELDQDERMVTGERMTEQHAVTVELTAEQVAGLGLPPGRYWLNGSLLDVDDHRVELPAVEQLRVPTRWLRAIDAARGPSHRDL